MSCFKFLYFSLFLKISLLSIPDLKFGHWIVHFNYFNLKHFFWAVVSFFFDILFKNNTLSFSCFMNKTSTWKFWRLLIRIFKFCFHILYLLVSSVLLFLTVHLALPLAPVVFLKCLVIFHCSFKFINERLGWWLFGVGMDFLFCAYLFP